MEISKIISAGLLLLTASSFAEFQFTAPAEKCVYGYECRVKCGPINRSQDVQFFRGGKPFVTCLTRLDYDYPCLIPSGSDDSGVQDIGYDTYFDSRISTLFIKITFYENDYPSNWTCKNGNEEATVTLEVGHNAAVSTFTTSDYLGTVGQEVELICQAVLIGSKTWPDTTSISITRNGDGSNLTTTVTTGYYRVVRAKVILKCTDHYFSCFATTGYGKTRNEYVEVNVKCPIQILYDMITTDVTIEPGKRRDLELYYAGYPVSTSWYKNLPEGELSISRVNGIIGQNIGSRKEIMFITNAKQEDAGQYTVYLKQNDTVIKVVYHVTVGGTYETGSTVIPKQTSSAPTLGSELNFTSPPENCVYGKKCDLTCGEINRSHNVQIFRGGKLFLTCLARNDFEGPCLIPPENVENGISDIEHTTYFDSRQNNLKVKIVFKESDFVSNWTCRNGNNEAHLSVDAGYTVSVGEFTIQSNIGTVGQSVRLTCQVVPIAVDLSRIWPDSVSTSITRNGDGSNLTSTVTKTNTGYFMTISSTVILKCTDHYFTCFATSGYGKRSSKYVEISVKCPMQILYDMITTDVTIELGKRRDLELYYAGYPVSTSWYKNLPEGDLSLGRVNGIIGQNIGSRKQILFITNAKQEDAGQYTVHVKQNDTVIKVVYHVTIVTPITTTTTTTTPTTTESSNVYTQLNTVNKTSNMSSTSSTSQQPNPNTNQTNKLYWTSTEPYKSSTQTTPKDTQIESGVRRDANNESCRQLSSVLVFVTLSFFLSFSLL